MGIRLTYIRTGKGWLYLTAILDLADRKVVGWALSETLVAEAIRVAAWQMAVRNRPLVPLRQGRTVRLQCFPRAAGWNAGAAEHEQER